MILGLRYSYLKFPHLNKHVEIATRAGVELAQGKVIFYKKHLFIDEAIT